MSSPSVRPRDYHCPLRRTKPRLSDEQAVLKEITDLLERTETFVCEGSIGNHLLWHPTSMYLPLSACIIVPQMASLVV